MPALPPSPSPYPAPTAGRRPRGDDPAALWTRLGPGLAAEIRSLVAAGGPAEKEHSTVDGGCLCALTAKSEGEAQMGGDRSEKRETPQSL